jgi:hypothetical protein
MSDSSKKYSTLKEELREEPTIDSALSSVAAARTHEDYYKRFSVGDMVVERMGYSSEAPQRFGIILDIYKDRTLSVRFVDGVDYSHASFCQLYSDWLADQRKKI